MTDTPVEEMPVQEEAPQEAHVEPEPVADKPEPVAGNCRWCGADHEQMPDEPEDWLCSECERYQDATICPMCGGLARVSALPPDMTPTPASPKKGKK